MEPLPRPEEKRAAVEAMFDRLAPRYDLLNRVITLGMDSRWRREIVRESVRPGDRVLDLACGTGDLALLAREAGARAVGLDYAANMLVEARQRGAGDLVRADALALPLATGSIDTIVSGFALRNFVALEPAFAEAARVLRPGGRLGLLEVDRPRNPLMRAGHRLYFDRAVPLVGGALSREWGAYRYLPASTAYLPPTPEMGRLLREAGFVRIRKRRRMGGAVQMIFAERR